MIEFIMDSKGLLYIIDLSKTINNILIEIFSNSHKIQRIQSAITRNKRQNSVENRDEKPVKTKRILISVCLNIKRLLINSFSYMNYRVQNNDKGRKSITMSSIKQK